MVVVWLYIQGVTEVWEVGRRKNETSKKLNLVEFWFNFVGAGVKWRFN